MHEAKKNVFELKNVSTVFVHTMKVIRAQNNTVCTIVCTKNRDIFQNSTEGLESHKAGFILVNHPFKKNNAITTFTVWQLDICLHFVSFPEQSQKKWKVAKEEAPFDVCCDDMSRSPWGMKAAIPFSPDRKPEHFASMSPSLICLTSHSSVSVSHPLSAVLPYFNPHF